MWSKEYTYDLKMDGQELQEGRQEYVVRFRVWGGGGRSTSGLVPDGWVLLACSTYRLLYVFAAR